MASLPRSGLNIAVKAVMRSVPLLNQVRRECRSGVVG